MIRVQCLIGNEAVYINPDDPVQHVHEALNAACATHCADGHPQDHPHGDEAAACPKEHEGECWHGPMSGPRPDGCTVCRPVLIEMLPGAATVRAA